AQVVPALIDALIRSNKPPDRKLAGTRNLIEFLTRRKPDPGAAGRGPDPALIEAIKKGDDDKACASIARDVGSIAHRLSDEQRRNAISAIEAAMGRIRDRQVWLFVGSSGKAVPKVLQMAADALRNPVEPTTRDLFANFCQRAIDPFECTMPQ